jgi:hypothetical protein
MSIEIEKVVCLLMVRNCRSILIDMLLDYAENLHSELTMLKEKYHSYIKVAIIENLMSEIL